LPENAEDEAEMEAVREVEKLLCAVKALNVTFIAVTNEVGMELCRETGFREYFRT